jgi:crotonobetainyl-CoA:carnitine CoA-transferase CaiB-like acyl-CoA transferase
MTDGGEKATPYGGLRVVELAGDPAGESLGKMLGTLGADVVKVELPEGSPTRSYGPWAGEAGGDAQDRSLAFWSYNLNKRGVVIDYRRAEGRAALQALLSEADVVITTWRPVEWEAFGFDPEMFRRDNDRLIVANVSPFGLDGPWADMVSSDLVGLALGGPLNSCGYDDHTIPPIRPGGNQGYQTATSFAHLGLLLALLQRQQTGQGQVVDVAMHDCLAVNAELANPYWFYPRVLVHRQTCRHAQPTPTQSALFATMDGRYVYFVLITAEQRPWRSLLEWMVDRDLAADLIDPAYDDPAYRLGQFAHIQELVEVFFLLQSASDAYHEGQARGLPIGVLNAPEDLLDDAHLQAREFFVPVEDNAGHTALHPGTPFRFSSMVPAPASRAPRLGEHDAELVARQWREGADASELHPARSGGTT